MLKKTSFNNSWMQTDNISPTSVHFSLLKKISQSSWKHDTGRKALSTSQHHVKATFSSTLGSVTGKCTYTGPKLAAIASDTSDTQCLLLSLTCYWCYRGQWFSSQSVFRDYYVEIIVSQNSLVSLMLNSDHKNQGKEFPNWC